MSGPRRALEITRKIVRLEQAIMGYEADDQRRAKAEVARMKR